MLYESTIYRIKCNFDSVGNINENYMHTDIYTHTFTDLP